MDDIQSSPQVFVASQECQERDLLDSCAEIITNQIKSIEQKSDALLALKEYQTLLWDSRRDDRACDSSQGSHLPHVSSNTQNVFLSLKNAADAAYHQFEELQARHSSENRALESQLNQCRIEIQNLSSNIQNLETVKLSQEEKLKTLQEALESRSAKDAQETNEQIRVLKEDMEKSAQDCKKLETQIQELTLQKESVEISLVQAAEVEEEAQALYEQLEVQDSEIFILKKMNKTLQDQVKLSFDRADASNQELMTKLAEVQSQLQSEHRERETLELQMDFVEEQDLEKDVEIGALLKIVTSLREQISIASRSRSDLEAEVSKLRREFQSKTERLASLDSTLEKMESDKVDLLSEKEFLRSINALFEEQIHVSFTSRDKLESDFLALEREFQKRFEDRKTESRSTETTGALEELKRDIHQKDAVISDLHEHLKVLELKLQESDAALKNLESSHTDWAAKFTTQEQTFSVSLESLTKEIESLKEEQEIRENNYVQNLHSLEKVSQERNAITSHQILDKDATIEKLGEQLTQFQDDLKLLLNEKEAIASKLQASESLLNQKDEEILALKGTQSLNQELDSALLEKERIQEALESSESKLLESLANISGLEHELAVVTEKHDLSISMNHELAKNSDQLKERLEVVEAELKIKVNQITTLEEEKTALSEAESRLDNEMKEVRASLAELEAQLSATQEEIDQLLLHKKVTSIKVQELEILNVKLKAQISKLEQDIASEKSLMSSFEHENLDLSETIKSLTADLKREEKDRIRIENENEINEREFQSTFKQYKELENSMKSLQEEKQELDKVLTKSRELAAILQEQHDGLLRRNEELSQLLDTKESSLKNLQDTLTTSMERVQALTIEVGQIKKERDLSLEELEHIKKDHQESMIPLKKEIDDFANQLRSLEIELCQKTSDNQALENSLAQQSQHVKSLEIKMEEQTLSIQSLQHNAQEAKALRDMMTALKEQVCHLQSQVSSEQHENKLLEDKLASSDRQVAHTQSLMVTLESQNEAFKSNLDKALSRAEDLDRLLTSTRSEKEAIRKELTQERDEWKKQADDLKLKWDGENQRLASRPKDLPSNQSQKPVQPIKRVLETSAAVNVTPMSKKVKNAADTPRGSALKQTNSKTSIGTPMPDFKDKKVLICFSGFKENTAFNSDLKSRLVKAIEQFPDACILSGNEDYDPRTTHVIAPASSRTLKTFAASLKSAWLIYDPNWVFESLKKGAWISETSFGQRYSRNPFARAFLKCISHITDKKCFLTPTFSQCAPNQQFRTKYLTYLIQECANGQFVSDPKDADIIFHGDQDKSVYGPGVSLDWQMFVAKIPQVKLN